MTEKFLRLSDVVQTTGIPRSSIYDLMGKEGFPRPVQLSARSVAWRETEIAAWQRSKIEARDGGTA